MRSPRLVSALAVSSLLFACSQGDEVADTPPADPIQTEAPAPPGPPAEVVMIENACQPDQAGAPPGVDRGSVRANPNAQVEWQLDPASSPGAFAFTVSPKSGTYWPMADSLLTGDRKPQGPRARLRVPPRSTQEPGDTMITYQVMVYCSDGRVEPIDPDIIIGQDEEDLEGR